MGIRCANHVTPLYPQKLALTSPTGGGRSVGIVRSRTKATERERERERELLVQKFVKCKYYFFCGLNIRPSVRTFPSVSSIRCLSLVNKSHVFLCSMSCVFQSKQNKHQQKICPFRKPIATLTVAQHRIAYRQGDLNIPTHRSNILHYFDLSVCTYEHIYT